MAESRQLVPNNKGMQVEVDWMCVGYAGMLKFPCHLGAACPDLGHLGPQAGNLLNPVLEGKSNQIQCLVGILDLQVHSVT